MFSQLQPIPHAPPSSPPDIQLTTRSRVKISTGSLQHDQFSGSKFHFLNGNINSTLYSSILDSCSCLKFGKQLHAHLLKNGFCRREFVGTKLLQMYGKFEYLDDAVLLFDRLPGRNLYSYAALMNLFLDNGLFKEAYFYLEKLLLEDVELEFFIFPVGLKICRGYGGVELMRQLHGLAIKVGVSSHIYVGNALIDMYGKCGNLNDAEKVLDNTQGRDSVSWNSIIAECLANGMVFEALEFLERMSLEYDLASDFVSWGGLVDGFARNGYDKEAIEVLYKMKAAKCEPNARTLTAIISSCARMKELLLGKEIYGYITRHGFMSSAYIANGLIDLYRKCDNMLGAFKVFSRFSERDEVSFNTMIAGYCESGEIHKARDLFNQMENEGKPKGLISWNSMISGYTDNSMFNEALTMFTELMNDGDIEPNTFTMGSALAACANNCSLRLGKSIHSYCVTKGLNSNLFVGGALVEMYCQCKDMEAGEKALHGVPVRDLAIWSSLVSGYARSNHIEKIPYILQKMKNDGFAPNEYLWNGIVAGYVENGFYESALQLFSHMWVSSLRPDVYTTTIVLSACSKLGTVGRGKQVHAYAIKSRFESDPYIVAALIDMYAKCGILKYAERVHNQTKNHTLVTQNAMLNAYTIHGDGEDGIAFFREMLLNRFKPNKLTFLAVLSSCVHAGSVVNGQVFFDLMECYDVMPALKHYTCMVDLLSRAGEIKLAYEVIESMSFDPDSIIWGALLSGCVIHGNVELGEVVAEKVMELEPENPGNYVMLANLYALNGKWGEYEKVRKQMKGENLNKDPGCSWIEDKGEMHVFMASDRSHKRAKEIHDILYNLSNHIRLEYV